MCAKWFVKLLVKTYNVLGDDEVCDGVLCLIAWRVSRCASIFARFILILSRRSLASRLNLNKIALIKLEITPEAELTIPALICSL